MVEDAQARALFPPIAFSAKACESLRQLAELPAPHRILHNVRFSMMLTCRNEAQWGRRPRQTPEEWRIDTDGLAALAFFWAYRDLREYVGGGGIPSRAYVLGFCRVAIDACAHPIVDNPPTKRYLIPSVPPPPANKDDRIARYLLQYDPVVRPADVMAQRFAVTRATFKYDCRRRMYVVDKISSWVTGDYVSEDEDVAEDPEIAEDNVPATDADAPDTEDGAPHEDAALGDAAAHAVVEDVEIEGAVLDDVVVASPDVPNLASDKSDRCSPPSTGSSPRVGDKRKASLLTPSRDRASSSAASSSAGGSSSDAKRLRR